MHIFCHKTTATIVNQWFDPTQLQLWALTAMELENGRGENHFRVKSSYDQGMPLKTKIDKIGFLGKIEYVDSFFRTRTIIDTSKIIISSSLHQSRNSVQGILYV